VKKYSFLIILVGVVSAGLWMLSAYVPRFFRWHNSGVEIGEQKEKINMLFVGDMMFDRSVSVYARKKGVDVLFGKSLDLFEGRDIVAGNLEGTITKNRSIAEKDHSILHFTFDPLYAGLLKSLHFSLVSLANNHASDFYEHGYIETVDYLMSGDIIAFGSPRNDKNIVKTVRVKGQNICFVGYHDLYTYDPEPAYDAVSSSKGDCSYIVVYPHWGEEYEVIQSRRQVELAHRFIDAGADLVIGAHPHVVQPLEIYKGKAIFYSLGNFMFDQYFSFETTHGLAVSAVLSEDSVQFEVIPTSVVGMELTKGEGEARKKILKALVNNDSLPESIRKSVLESGKFETGIKLGAEVGR